MTTRRKLQAAVSAMAFAAALCLMGMTGAGPAAAATSCVPTMLIGVHGTGEETGVIGDELSKLYNGVVAHTGLPEQGLSGWTDDSTFNTDLAAALLLGVNQLAAAVAKLQAAVDAGAADLYNQITAEASQCPGEHFIVAGFSQGAAVVGEFARNHPQLAGRVSGVILWADPEFNGDDSFSTGAVANGGFTGTGGWQGVLAWFHNERLTFPSAWSGRLRSYCTTLDPVCNWSLSLGAVLDLTNHGDERFSPIINDSESLIQDPFTGWAPSVWDGGGTETFYTNWQSAGGDSGLGQPTGDPVSEPGGGVGQTFSGASCNGSGSAILWTPATGTHEMHGCIYNAYLTTYGGPAVAGYPVSDERNDPTGTGRMNYMSGSSCGSATGSAIYWNGAAHLVRGCAFQTYKANGETSHLGFPMADEYTDSSGWHQVFQNGRIDNGVVTYNDCNAGRFSDGNLDQGIFNAYVASGGNGSLGCPTDNGGGVYVHWWGGPQANVQDFAGGSLGPAIIVDGPHGTYFVNYGFRNAYINQGWSATCGPPTDNAHDANGGTQQDFVGCYMTWTSSAGVIVHTGCASYGANTTGPDDCAGSFTAPDGTWNSGGGHGLLGREIWTYVSGSSQITADAQYVFPNLTAGQKYQVQAYIPDIDATAYAHYRMNGASDVYIDQYPAINAWVNLGYECPANFYNLPNSIIVALFNDGGANHNISRPQVGADAIRVFPVSSGPQC